MDKLQQVAEIAGVERELEQLEARRETLLAYRKSLYADLGLDDAAQVIELAVSGKARDEKPKQDSPGETSKKEI